ncbi:Protein of unknown function [Pyronema omphalodes CBS 100304]|uniref:Uncharacterized protein n=1 Tax=Pyronema omphalodes (strain CBS 100304) TaxID=1076935 RepID=U4LMI1_PYROM|nr:Protein of unknown function [Pyronema omphalodes CBS 100304]
MSKCPAPRTQVYIAAPNAYYIAAPGQNAHVQVPQTQDYISDDIATGTVTPNHRGRGNRRARAARGRGRGRGGQLRAVPEEPVPVIDVDDVHEPASEIPIDPDILADSQPEINRHWSMAEKELLLNWLSGGLMNYQQWKNAQEKSSERISVLIFEGTHTTSAIRNQWKILKERYIKARDHMESTGHGDIEPAQRMEAGKIA